VEHSKDDNEQEPSRVLVMVFWTVRRSYDIEAQLCEMVMVCDILEEVLILLIRTPAAFGGITARTRFFHLPFILHGGQPQAYALAEERRNSKI